MSSRPEASLHRRGISRRGGLVIGFSHPSVRVAGRDGEEACFHLQCTGEDALIHIFFSTAFSLLLLAEDAE